MAYLLDKLENIVAKGEIAHDEQFHFWPQCFQKLSAAIASKYVCRWGKGFYYLDIIITSE